MATVVTNFSYQDALAVETWMDLLRGLWSYGDFKLRESDFPSLVAKLYIGARTVLEVQERARGPLSQCQIWWGSYFTYRLGGQKTLSFCYWHHCVQRKTRVCKLLRWQI